MGSRDRRYRIVVGHDLENDGDEALREAVALAARIGAAELHVVHVLPATSNVGQSSRMLDDALAALAARTDAPAFRDGPEVALRFHVRLGDVARQIHQVAVDHDADLLFVGTRGRTGLDRLRHGSIAEQLARTARLPVLVAHAKDFRGLSRADAPDPAIPGAELRRDQIVSEVVVVGRRTAHISGLL